MRRMSPNSPPAAAAAEEPLASFYRIIVQSVIDDHKLRIPEDFAEVYESELSSYATFVVPNGRIFRIKVEKSESALWLNQGWEDFAEHLSIRKGFFIVFDYEGNSKFNVNIFDLTATEIQYPQYSLRTCNQPKIGKQSEVLEKSGTKSGRAGTTPRRSTPKQKTHISSKDVIFKECPLQGGKRKRCFHSLLPKIAQFAPEFAMTINNYGKCISKSFSDSLRSNFQHETRNKRRKLENLGEMRNKQRKLEDLGEATREEPPKSTVVSNSPMESATEESSKENHEDLVENSRSSKDSHLRNPTGNAVKKGQKSSADLEDKDLKTLTGKGEGGQMKVKQEKGKEVIGVDAEARRVAIIREKERAVHAALALKLRNPYFMNILNQNNVDRGFILHVPSYFGDKYLSSRTHFLKLQGPDGKQWQVSCFTDGEVQYLSRGWVAFVKEYNLLQGDVCIFELIQLDEAVLKVHIFRPNQTSPSDPTLQPLQVSS